MKNNSIKKAIFINFLSKYSGVVITIIINSILARLLTPSDYGIVAVISVFIGFFTILADLGIGPAIIQNKNINKKQISDIFIFTVILGVIISFIFYILSYGIAYIYNNDVYIQLGKILSLGLFFSILNMVPNALLLKNKQFKSLAIRNIVIIISGGILTIILAYLNLKYYALVLNTVFTSFITFIFNFKYSKIRVEFNFKLQSLSEIKEFATYQFASNFVNYFSRNLDNLLIGGMLGDVALGYYDKAYKLMLYPVQNLTHVITPVLHPILSEYQTNKNIIYKKYMNIVRILSLLGVFFSIFCFFSAKEIIFIMFGEKWSESINSFKILSISILPQMVTGSAGSIFQSTGDTKYLFKSGIINTTITVVCITIGVFIGNIENVALFVTGSYWIHFIVAFYILLKRVFKTNFKYIINIEIKVFIIALIMIIFYIIIPTNNISIVFSIIIKGFIGIFSYILGLIITKEYTIIEYLKLKN